MEKVEKQNTETFSENQLLSKFYTMSPYQDIPEHYLHIDKQGWNSRNPFFVSVIEFLKPRLVIEVGVWKGMSAIFMASTMKSLGIDGQIICIDTWLGSVEHWINKGKKHFESLRLENGRPNIYYTFLSNVLDEGHEDMIIPLPQTSNNGYEILKKLNIKADLIHIDASHEYEDVVMDIKNYWEILSDDGIMIVDDYIAWPGVTRAVDEFVKRGKYPMMGHLGKCIISKNKSYNISVNIS